MPKIHIHVHDEKSLSELRAEQSADKESLLSSLSVLNDAIRRYNTRLENRRKQVDALNGDSYLNFWAQVLPIKKSDLFG